MFLKKIYKYILVSSIILVIFFVWVKHFVAPYFFPIEDTRELNYGFESLDALPRALHQANVTNYIYFDTFVSGFDSVQENNTEDILVPSTYVYDLINNTTYPLMPGYISRDMNPISENEAVFMTPLPIQQGNSTTSVMLPVIFNTITSEYTALVGTVRDIPVDIAYSSSSSNVAIEFVFQDVANTGYQDPTKRYIALFNSNTGLNIRLKEAFAPQWLPNGTQLLFVRQNGIYVYDSITDTETIIFSRYQNLDSLVDLAVSPSGESMILTLPKNNAISISVISRDSEKIAIEEVAAIQAENTRYSSPVFSADSRYYAMIAYDVNSISQKEKEITGTKKLANQGRIEIYSLDTNVPIRTLALPTEAQVIVQLSQWADVLINQPEVN